GGIPPTILEHPLSYRGPNGLAVARSAPAGRATLRRGAPVRSNGRSAGAAGLASIEVGEEPGEVGHLPVTVLQQPLPDSVREELNARVAIGSEVRWVKVAKPEPAPHLTAVGRITAQVDQMCGPHWRVERPNAGTYGGADASLGEPRHIEVLGRLAELHLQLVQLAADVFVDVVRAADEPPRSTFADPLAPHMVERVPPFVLSVVLRNPNHHSTMRPLHPDIVVHAATWS